LEVFDSTLSVAVGESGGTGDQEKRKRDEGNGLGEHVARVKKDWNEIRWLVSKKESTVLVEFYD